MLILTSSLVLILGRCALTVSCTRLLGNPSNLFSYLFLSDFLGSPVPYILNFWAYTIQNCNYIFTHVYLRTNQEVLFTCIFPASLSMLGKYHSINICWTSEQIPRQTQFPFCIPPCSGWKHDWFSCLAFPWVCNAFFQSQVEEMEKRFSSRTTLANLLPVLKERSKAEPWVASSCLCYYFPFTDKGGGGFSVCLTADFNLTGLIWMIPCPLHITRDLYKAIKRHLWGSQVTLRKCMCLCH